MLRSVGDSRADWTVGLKFRHFGMLRSVGDSRAAWTVGLKFRHFGMLRTVRALKLLQLLIEI